MASLLQAGLRPPVPKGLPDLSTEASAKCAYRGKRDFTENRNMPASPIIINEDGSGTVEPTSPVTVNNKFVPAGKKLDAGGNAEFGLPFEVLTKTSGWPVTPVSVVTVGELVPNQPAMPVVGAARTR